MPVLSARQAAIRCPTCGTSNVPSSNNVLDGVYLATCPTCNHQYKFKATPTPKTSVTFTINGKQYTVRNEHDVTMKLNEYLREVVGLKDTKVMCYEGGCGSCLVAATMYDPLTKKNKTISINSCLCPVYSCDGWAIITTAGIGNKQSGFHPIQEQLADHNGSQCGYCSPGMVMNMYGFLQENPNPTMQQIEDAFDGNICRCTGYRPILDAMQTFSGTAGDIEDLGKKHCTGQCGTTSCSNNCDSTKPVHMVFSDSQWFKPKTLPELLSLMQQFKGRKIAYVVGGTNLGYGSYDVYIDTKGLQELYATSLSSSPPTFGTNVTMNEFITLLQQLSKRSGFEYCSGIVTHIGKVANRPVRNSASLGGNLMWKYTDHSFPSDLFLILETVGAQVTLMSSDGTTYSCTPEQFLAQSMPGRIVYRISLPELPPHAVIRTYKVMPRNQSSLAHVNAGFHMLIDESSGYRVTDVPSIVFGGISATMNHAAKTEHFLVGKSLLDPSVLQDAFNILSSEIIPDFDPTEPSPAYRKSLALALFYKFVLSVCRDQVAQRLISGALPLVRPVSSGTETFDTDRSKWPLTEPLPKIASKLQAAGEALYTNDMPAFEGELYAEFVVTTQGNAKIQNIDPSAALQIPGVMKYISVSDIPEGGVNNYMPAPSHPEELFCSGQVLYAGQSVGLIIADTKSHAIAGAGAVQITYTDIQPPILTIKDALAKQSLFPKPGSDIVMGNAEQAIANSPKKVSGEVSLGDQYHFQMETQSCIAVPKEDGMDLYPTSQWVDLSQAAAAMVLGVPVNSINASVKRLGGAYGCKITRNFQVGAAAALASQIMNRPVRIFTTLSTNMEMIGKRVPYLAQYQIGLSNEGLLNGVKITYYSDCGCNPNDNSIGVALANGDNAYYCDNWHLIPAAVKTNLPSTTAMRAPGWLPGIFIMEHVMEHCSKALGIDPIAFRRKNLVKKGQSTPGGQVLDHCKIDELMDSLTASAQVTQRLADISTFNQMNR